MLVLLAVIGAVSLALLAGGGLAALRLFGDVRGILDRTRAIMEGAYRVDEKGLEARFRDLEDLVDRLPQRWEDIKREAARLDARARYAVGRSREELASRGLTDERLDELGAELRILDGEGSEESGVLPMRGAMESVPAPAQQPPSAGDWQSLARARKWGGA